MGSFVSSLDSKFKPKYSVKEFGLHLTYGQRAEIERRLSSFSKQIPFPGTIEVSFFSKGKSIKASFFVHLFCGKAFRATRTYRLPAMKLFDLLEKEIHGQLMRWKREGLIHKALKNSSSNIHRKLTGGYAV